MSEVPLYMTFLAALRGSTPSSGASSTAKWRVLLWVLLCGAQGTTVGGTVGGTVLGKVAGTVVPATLPWSKRECFNGPAGSPLTPATRVCLPGLTHCRV